MIAQTMPGHLIRRLNQLSTRVFAAHMQTEGHKLTPVQFAALDAISANPGIDQAGVAAKIAYDRATIGGVIDRMVQKGYVTRSVSKQDRRARELHLSDKGTSLLSRITPIIEDLQSEILQGLSAEERQTFMALAAKVLATEDHPAPPDA